MRLFPSRKHCAQNIRAFHKKNPNDVSDLSTLWQKLTREQTPDTLSDAQGDLLKLLKRWQAYRNQPSRRNEAVLEDLLKNQGALTALRDLIQATQATSDLTRILEHKTQINAVFDFFKARSLQDDVPARIVTVSKAMLMTCGFTVGLDSKVLGRIRKANPYLLACPGVWPSCLYFETLQYIANEQRMWEEENGPMHDLLEGFPIGQIMDMILWRNS
ncbi:MAG: hypothetical protein M1378_12150 [Bacteroidetes bacterium]|jgi:hypothetical protein|nr:hypothetical protein [Bacteroidota bacterium]